MFESYINCVFAHFFFESESKEEVCEDIQASGSKSKSSKVKARHRVKEAQVKG